MFDVGDKVVYPNHGIGEIRDVAEIKVGGHEAKFFEVFITSSKSVVKVPAGNAESVGLRKLISKDDIENVYAYMRSEDLVEYEDWKERFKLNSDLMRTGKVNDMMKVLKNLYFVSLEKPLSFREKRMYERATQLIASELAEVRKATVREVEDSLISQLEVAANNAGLPKPEED
jgi:CarD family transcriptional regulator